MTGDYYKHSSIRLYTAGSVSNITDTDYVNTLFKIYLETNGRRIVRRRPQVGPQGRGQRGWEAAAPLKSF